MGFMEIMGSKSVRYHAENVMGRADDHPGRRPRVLRIQGGDPAFAGGDQGLRPWVSKGAVTDHQCVSIYGEGGAKDPVTGERLVHTKRPGMEIVIAAHKSVAELGVIGRAEDMHAIVDAERTPPWDTWTG